MSTKKIEDSIATLEAKLKQKRAALAVAESRRRAAASKKARSDDTRRKILLGALWMKLVTSGEWSETAMHDLLAIHLERADDRALFGLAPIAPPSA